MDLPGWRELGAWRVGALQDFPAEDIGDLSARRSGITVLDLDGGTATIHRSLQRTRSQGLTAGLQTIHFHDLRHSTATLLLEQGVELVVTKELLGHTHIGVTAAVYTHVRPWL
ncbi:tyrosine-type recombinase/integrase [Streptomyces sp. NPDC058308]|uniref:tyrosine-type recombinase/integrase n=1 Tax=Streptomyces sp. NPDC058308 TaxID=3346440 RepID=UPI0036EABB7A